MTSRSKPERIPGESKGLRGDQWPLLLDGGMGTALEAARLERSGTSSDGSRGGRAEDAAVGTVGCPELLNAADPELVGSVHRRYLEAGSHAVETNTFGGTAIKLGSFGLAERTGELNRAGARIARQAADRSGGLVIGSLGPSGELPGVWIENPAAEPAVGVRALRAVFAEQAAALLTGGVDVLLVETSQDLLELRCAILGCREAMKRAGRKVPLWGSVSLHLNGRMLLGTGIDAALAVALALDLDAFGINCATGPEEMTGAVRFLCDHSPLPVIVCPNAGIPEERDGRAVFPLGPEAFARAMMPFLEMGVEIVGGCCGTSPAHIEALRGVLTAHRPRRAITKNAVRVASAVAAQDLLCAGSPLIVGERLNTQGSRRFKKLLLKRSWERIGEVARTQESAGAQVLDLASGLAERQSERDDMLRLVRQLAAHSALPLMIDALDPEVIESALEHYPGVALVNSINLEDRGRCERVLDAVARHGAAVVALTIDESGMAYSLKRKIAAADKLYNLAVRKHAIPPGGLLFDPLTLTLATGKEDLRDSARDTLAAVCELRKRYPLSGVILGVSNVSFGLPRPARAVLNAVFLHHAIQAGLTAALVNPAEIVGYHDLPEVQRALAEELIFNRRPDALERFVESTTAPAEPGNANAEDSKTKRSAEDASRRPEEELSRAVIERRAAEIEKVIAACLERLPAKDVLEEVLLPAMKEVGERMNRGETILPHVLRSAEVMSRALQILGAHLGAYERNPCGKVVLATVFGDVHDIGKNLVATILANNGFEVVDLGKQVPTQVVVDAVLETKPLAVGLSALLISTSAEMVACVSALGEKGASVPVILGGAAVSPALARRAAAIGTGEYAGGVHYAKDAFAGLEICRRLARERSNGPDDSVTTKGGDKGFDGARAKGGDGSRPDREPSREKPFDELRDVKDHEKGIDSAASSDRGDDLRQVTLSTDAVLARIGFGEKSALTRPPREIEHEVQAVIGGAIQGSSMRVAAVYGFFPGRLEGDILEVLSARTGRMGSASRRFRLRLRASPRSAAVEAWFDRSDRFIPYLVTLGAAATAVYDRLARRGHLALSQEWAALCAQATEAAAQELRDLLCTEIGLDRETAQPFGVSPGYPLWPDLADQVELLELVQGHRLAVTLTERFQLVPEYSTTGMVVYSLS